MERSGDRVSAELLGDTFEALGHARALGTLRREIAKFTQQMGFDRFAYALRVTAPSLPPEQYAMTDYPAAWGERYIARGYFKLDPIVVHCERSSLPALWDEDAFHDPRASEFWEEADSYGLRSGLSIAVRDGSAALGVFSLSRDKRLDARGADLAALIGRASVFATILQHAVSRIRSPLRSSWPTSSLTAREVECLKWTIDGKTAREIGQILGITERTVGFHLSNVMPKLGAANKAQAAARALALNLLR
jgi:LuxR family transcriptional regulator, quorum-sensing system regulator SolR